MVVMGAQVSPCSQDPPVPTLEVPYSLGAQPSLWRSLQKLAPPGKDVSTEHTTNDVSKVRDIVDIRECTGDKHIPLPSHRQPGKERKRKDNQRDVRVKKILKNAQYT